jgi:MOSC domain-containing protein YiiM
MTTPTIESVSLDGAHRFSKRVVDEIVLLEGLGVQGDAHAGVTVQHRSRVARDPEAPNLRQVHLIQAELFDEVAEDGFTVAPGALGENVTTRGIDLLELPRGTVLHLGEEAVIEVTGLRNPCTQINGIEQGLMKRLIEVDNEGTAVRKAGVMSVVLNGGVVRTGDRIRVVLPEGEHHALETV